MLICCVFKYLYVDFVIHHLYKSILNILCNLLKVVTVSIRVMTSQQVKCVLNPSNTFMKHLCVQCNISRLYFRSSGVKVEQVSLPATITQWVGKAVCVHPQVGVGASEQAKITAFTPFFLDLTLPPSVKRGETLPVKISIFNYLNQTLPVSFSFVFFLQLETLQSGEINTTSSLKELMELIMLNVLKTQKIVQSRHFIVFGVMCKWFQESNVCSVGHFCTVV